MLSPAHQLRNIIVLHGQPEIERHGGGLMQIINIIGLMK